MAPRPAPRAAHPAPRRSAGASPRRRPGPGKADRSLLEDGTAAVLATYGDTYAAVRTEPSLLQWYENFETINSRFIAAAGIDTR